VIPAFASATRPYNFLEKRLEIFFRGLLAMKARGVSMRPGVAGERARHFPVLFGFEHPLRGLPLHIEFSLSPLSRAETNRRLLVRAPIAKGCAQSGRA
jgi:hypothetical protein